MTAPTVLSGPSTLACCVAVCDISGAVCTRTGCDGVHDVEGQDCWTDTPNNSPERITMIVTDDMRLNWDAQDLAASLRDQHDAAADAATARVDFQLTYARASQPRTVNLDAIDGDPIPNAYGTGMQLNEWHDDDLPADPSVDAWIDKYAHMAVSEAVHEALEWFRVDGKPWIDPHAQLEMAVQAEVRALCARLAELRRGTSNDNEASRTE